MARVNTKSEQIVRRLNFKSYLRVIRNSVGSNMFRNLYVHTDKAGEFDALDDGSNSCAFYVSSILLIFGKVSGLHGTIGRTLEDMEESGWVITKKPKLGDVVLWEAQEFEDGRHEHMGFYIGKGRAISTSSKQKIPAEHDQNFGKEKRIISKIYRMKDWDDKP